MRLDKLDRVRSNPAGPQSAATRGAGGVRRRLPGRLRARPRGADRGVAQHRAEPERARACGGRSARTPTSVPVRRGRLVVGTHRTEQYDDDPTWFERVTRLPLVRAAAAGPACAAADPRRLRHRARRSPTRSRTTPRRIGADGVVIERGWLDQARSSRSSSQAPGQGGLGRQGGAHRWGPCQGRLHLRRRDRTRAAPRSPTGPSNLTDGVADTTWRCDGTAIGEKITLSWPTRPSIGEVGLIPGYAKTDESSGEDRYAENNRVTRCAGPSATRLVEQRMSGAADDRSLRLLRVPQARRRRGRAGDPRGEEGSAEHHGDQRDPARAHRLSGGQPEVSRIIVTGPSLTSSTAMSAPNTPRSTWVPSSSSPAHTAS